MKVTRKQKIAGIAVGLLAVGGIVAGCNDGTPSGQASENAQQQRDQAALEQTQPLPHFNYSQLRQSLIDSEIIAANGVQTTSFGFQQGDANPIWSCPSIGMPVPANASLSNPEQVVNAGGSSGNPGVAIGQQDPDGIYTSPSSSGTFVLCVNNAGQKYLQYWEGNVDTVAAGAVWQNGTILVNGAPTFTPGTKANH